MSKFVSDKLVEIDCGDDEWVKIPEKLSYGDMEGLNTEQADKGKVALEMLVLVIKEWNFKDEDGNIPEVNEENIRKLDITITTKLTGLIMDKMGLSKKKLETLKEQLEDTEEVPNIPTT